jgi:hypothetical protein
MTSNYISTNITTFNLGYIYLLLIILLHPQISLFKVMKKEKETMSLKEKFVRDIPYPCLGW